MTCKPSAAALAAMLLLGGCGSGNHNGNGSGSGNNGGPHPAPQPRLQAQIQRTAYGIAHIQADNEQGLGFGMGYAYAEDNFCLLAGEIVTVNGERARHFGAEGSTSNNPEEAVKNLESDFFFKVMNDDETVRAAWQAQPAEVRGLLSGYAAGVNRWLGEKGKAGLPEGCRNAAWVRPVTEQDLLRLMRRMVLTDSAMSLLYEITGAQPPGAANPPAAARALRRPITASNGIAVGAEASADGRGLVLGQPHLPWGTALRFWQVHLTIPGKMDVMGAALPGLPVVGIGFTKDFAWTHTTDTSAHFTVYRLELDPGDPTRYIVDGQSKPLLPRNVTVQVKNPDGSMGTQERTLYGTDYGPLLAMPGKLDWTRRYAYALRDANAANHRALAQWHAIDKARTLAELKAVNLQIVGNPWNYTIAADRAGDTLLMNVSPVANVSDDMLARCLVNNDAELLAGRVHVLDGSRGACAWRDEPGAVQPGTVPPGSLPVLERRDFVQNANDSAWLSNPAAPLKGYPALVSRDSVPQGARTRMVLTQLYELLRGKAQITADDLRRMALDDRAYLAPLLLPDLLDWCGTAGSAELAAGCAGLAAWNGRAGSDAGLGMYHFTALAGGISNHGAWRVPFDPADPIGTPSGVDHREPAIAKLLADTLGYTVRTFDEGGVPRDAKLGQVQVTRQGGKTVPIHGGAGVIGVLSATETMPEPRDGLFDVVAGTTYVQVVGFDSTGPRAQALLAYSQSSDPASPHASDQTELFSKRQWVTLPFTEGEIAADPALRRRVISAE